MPFNTWILLKISSAIVGADPAVADWARPSLAKTRANEKHATANTAFRDFPFIFRSLSSMQMALCFQHPQIPVTPNPAKVLFSHE
jgi:hypothetical protein